MCTPAHSQAERNALAGWPDFRLQSPLMAREDGSRNFMLAGMTGCQLAYLAGMNGCQLAHLAGIRACQLDMLSNARMMDTWYTRSILLGGMILHAQTRGILHMGADCSPQVLWEQLDAHHLPGLSKLALPRAEYTREEVFRVMVTVNDRHVGRTESFIFCWMAHVFALVVKTACTVRDVGHAATLVEDLVMHQHLRVVVKHAAEKVRPGALVRQHDERRWWDLVTSCIERNRRALQDLT
eukprot:364152-Chlamydomonas_euryale.AAC.10